MKKNNNIFLKAFFTNPLVFTTKCSMSPASLVEPTNLIW